MVLGPVQAFTGTNTKLRWTELYTSDSINKAFLGVPRGIYLGFTPSVSGQVLTLHTDKTLIFNTATSSPFTVGDTVTGGASGATAIIRLAKEDLPGRGFISTDAIVGTFNEGETINAPGASATLAQATDEGISVAKLSTTSSQGGGRSEEAITIILDADVTLDFSPATVVDGIYFVKITASYEIGQESSAQVIAILDGPPDGRFEVGICSVTKFGATLVLDPITLTNRTDPFADNTTRAGLMPGEAIKDLDAALSSVAEVVAARTGQLGSSFGVFDPAQPKTTGLPGRLNADLERARMAAGLGKELSIVRGNDYNLQSIPSANTLNISGSFSGKTRTSQPFKDISTGNFPTGISVPVLINSDGVDGLTLTVTNAVGAFSPGDKIVGTNSGGSAVVSTVAGDQLDIVNLANALFVGEEITSSGTSATISAIDNREGAITAPESGIGGDPERNVVYILDTFTGKMPTNSNGASIYGRLLFGPNGVSGTGGGDPGELLVAQNSGELLNYTNGSTAITNNNLDFTDYFIPGDLVEGADGRFYEIDQTAGSVQANTLFLTTGKPYVGPNASAGFGVGPGPRRRLRYLLKFVSKTGGVESDEVIDVDSIPTGAALRIFFPAWFLRARSNYSASFELLTVGDAHAVPDAGSNIPGIGYNAAIGPTAPIIGALKAFQVAGIDPGLGNYHTINYQTGTVTETSPGVVSINAVGPQGPSGGTGPTPPGPPGPQGLGFENIFATLPTKIIPLSSGSGSDTFDFSPRKIRFYMITQALSVASTGGHNVHISGVTPTPLLTDSTITFTYSVSGTGNTMVVYCAAATD